MAITARFSASAAASRRFSVKRSDDFDISDCAVLPPGDLLLLERRFSLPRASACACGAFRSPRSSRARWSTVQLLVEADMAYQIDNMEGLGVHRTAEGATVLTLVSDDNFSPIQRTLLLQFTLVGE